MRLLLEHHWVASLTIAAIGVVILWSGLRENLLKRMGTGASILLIAVVVWAIGFYIETPSEKANRVVRNCVNAVIEGRIHDISPCISQEVILVDSWKNKSEIGKTSILESASELHRRHTLSYVTILKCEPVEREGDVQVELVLLARVSGIGTVPSTWRLLVDESENGNREIYSIDAIEIAGRSFR